MPEVAPQEFAEALESAIAEGHAAILVGAGVSMLPPSSLPGGNSLRDSVVEALCKIPETTEFWNSLISDPSYASLLPERAFQRIFEVMDKSLFDLLANYFVGTTPNEMHRLFGAVANLSVPVLTSNFDLLIDVCSESEIFHVHGRLDSPEAMTLRIEQVGIGLLSELRREFVRRVQNKRLFVFGYSGRDRDIIDAINSAGVLEVWWTDMVLPPGVARLNISRIFTCITNLSDLVILIKKYLFIKRTTDRVADPHPASVAMDLALAKMATSDRYFCIVKLAAEIGKFSLCATVCESALATITKKTEIARFGAYAILAYRELGRPVDAEKWADLGLKAVKGGNAYVKASMFNAVGILYLERRPQNLIKALTSFDQAVSYQLEVCANPPFRQNEPLVFWVEYIIISGGRTTYPESTTRQFHIT